MNLVEDFGQCVGKLDVFTWVVKNLSIVRYSRICDSFLLTELY